MFDEVRALYEAGSPVTEIARKLGLGPRRVYRWVRRIDLPEPSAMEPKVCTPAYFGAFLARSWAEGTTKVRHLFSDIRHRGYTGSFSHLARFLAPWRSSSSPSGEAGEPPSSDEEAPAPPHVRTPDPTTGRQISPLTAAAHCVKPRSQITDRQIVNVNALKAASVEFTAMRHLAMRFRGLLRGGTAQSTKDWARSSPARRLSMIAATAAGPLVAASAAETSFRKAGLRVASSRTSRMSFSRPSLVSASSFKTGWRAIPAFPRIAGLSPPR
jgi:hypothetical protein